MELLILPSVKQRLLETLVGEEDVRRVFASEGGVLDPVSGTVVKGGRIGAITLWLELRPVENGYRLETFYIHRIAVDGVPVCTER